MTEQAVVKVKLQYDERASDTTKKFSVELKNLDKTSDESMKKAAGGAKTAATSMGFLKGATVAAGAAMLAAGAAAAVMLGAGTIASMFAANSQLEKIRATTAQLVSLSPEKNMTFSRATEAARAFENEFRKISIAARVSRDDIRSAFQMVASQQGNVARLTLKDAETITRNMAMASAFTPGGMSALSKEYENLKTGMFSSSGSIVQMITSTGVLKGNAVEVAKQLASKDTITRMKLAEEAMAKMAKQSAGPTGFEGLKTAFGTIGSGVMETIGTPIINKVLPVFESVIGWFEKNDAVIQRTAEHVGDAIAGVVTYASGFMDTLTTVFGVSTDSVSNVIKDAADYIKSAFRWVYDNREPLAKTFRDIAAIFEKIMGGIVRAGQFIQSITRKVLDKVDSARGYVGPNRESLAEFDALSKNASKPGQTGADFAARKQKLEASIAAQGLGDEAKKYVAALDAMAASTAQSVAPFDALANKFTDEGRQKMLEGYRGPQEGYASMAAMNIKSSALEFIDAYNIAVKSHDDGKIRYVEGLVKGNEDIQKALLEGADKFEGGVVAFARKVGDQGFIKSAQERAKGMAGTKAMAPQVNFNGATFNIKQDFRDQDPDRVAIVFRDDIAKNAIARTQASTQTPFGL
jgi:hypothetical protein